MSRSQWELVYLFLFHVLDQYIVSRFEFSPSFQVVAVKPSAAIITTMVFAWSFLLTTVDGWKLNPKDWQE